MKAKLIKTEGSYILKDGLLQVIGIDDKNLKDRLNCNYLLSTKNCQAIENGYDLDELARKEILYNDQKREWWKQGAKYILEIMGDKKFSEKDMGKAWSEGYHRKVDELNGNGLRYFDKFIQSLQQTEWEVEIEMENYEPLYGMGSTPRPKLDANGCLILKRI